MRRFLAVGAVAALILFAFAVAQRPITANAASSTGNLTITSVAYPDSGCALGPAFTFCDQASGTMGPAAQFNVEAGAAVSSVAVSIAAVPGLAANFAAGDFTLSANTCTGNLAANQQCQISVAFSPSVAGLRQAQITATDAEGDTLSFNIQGTGSQLALAPPAPANCTPAVLPDNAYMFCTQSINPMTPTTETFTLSSASGSTGVNVTLAAIPGLESEFASGDFTIETPPCPSTIPAGGNCSIGAAFTPTAAGLRSAALTATDSAGDTTTIYLAGSATSGLTVSSVLPGDSQPCGTMNHFIFCSLPVGGVAAATTFTLVNSSLAQVTGLTVPKGSVLAQGATASDFTVQNTSCTSVLDAGSTCNVSVAFTPTKTGLRQGAIVITDAQGDVATVNLAGVGDDYSMATELPTEVSVIPGGTATFNATLTPDNVLGMDGEQVTFVCPTNLPANTSCAVTPCPAMIAPGTPVSVTVSLVTSSATVVAPVPPSGCSSYGPSIAALMRAPFGEERTSPGNGADASRGSPLYDSLLILGALGVFGLLWAAFAVPEGRVLRNRLALIFVSAGLAAAILSGCRHHAPTVTTATPVGVTTLTVLGNALDASGNSLNTSRQFQVTLDVVTK